MIWNDSASLEFHKVAIPFLFEIKGTLSYETLKVGSKKLYLVFHLDLKLKSVFLKILNNLAKFGFSQCGHDCFSWPLNEKLREL